jgi:hypothetical protein
VQLYCANGEYNDLATLYLVDSETAIRFLFHLRAYFTSVVKRADQVL